MLLSLALAIMLQLIAVFALAAGLYVFQIRKM
jgi:hypothetical protein